MKVSLVATVKDAREHIGEFLASIRAQTRPPDEIVIADGGSTDGTVELLRDAADVTVLLEPGANIARGRNIAVEAAAHDVIAVSDADCVLAPDWLEHLLEPIGRGADISAGAYRALAATPFQRWAAAVSVPDPDELRPGWMPSARSIAFTRRAFAAAGGYPEWLDIGEDMYVNHRWVEAGLRIELAPLAVTTWRTRPTLASTWRQYAAYAAGDAEAGMYTERHAIRFATYAAAAVAAVTRNRVLLALAVGGAAVHARTPLMRSWQRSRSGAERLASLAGVPATIAFVDAAKMWGYVRGLRSPADHE
jgi:glycosyltransferase involved in cell wall biosynthesis